MAYHTPASLNYPNICCSEQCLYTDPYSGVQVNNFISDDPKYKNCPLCGTSFNGPFKVAVHTTPKEALDDIHRYTFFGQSRSDQNDDGDVTIFISTTQCFTICRDAYGGPPVITYNDTDFQQVLPENTSIITEADGVFWFLFG